MPELMLVNSDADYAQAARLFKAYADWLGIDLGFQHFEEEMSNLRLVYGPPYGAILLCREQDEIIGCVAIRKIDVDTAELKRMYVLPGWQGKGIGFMLLKEAIRFAKNVSYKKIRLDTLAHMLPAIRLYRENGFYEIGPYYFNPEKTALYFEKLL